MAHVYCYLFFRANDTFSIPANIYNFLCLFGSFSSLPSAVAAAATATTSDASAVARDINNTRNGVMFNNRI